MQRWCLTEPLLVADPDWLRNLARGLVSKMVLLDTFNDNLYLASQWRCIAVHLGARSDRSTQVAPELAKSFFKLRTAPNNIPRTSLDELDKVERHLNQRLPLTDWLCIRVYEPEREDDREVIWHLRKNPPDKLKNILTIGIYDGYASLIKDINRLTRTHVCIYLQSTLYTSLEPSKTC